MSSHVRSACTQLTRRRLEPTSRRNMGTRVGIELSPVACRIVELEAALTSCLAGRRRRACGRTAVLPPSGPETDARFASIGRRPVAVVVWGVRSDHRQVVVSNGSYEKMRGRSAGVGPGRGRGHAGHARRHRAGVDGDQGREPASRSCSRWPTRPGRVGGDAAARRRRRPHSIDHHAGRRASGAGAIAPGVCAGAGPAVSKRTSRSTPRRRAWRSSATGRCSVRASCRGAMKSEQRRPGVAAAAEASPRRDDLAARLADELADFLIDGRRRTRHDTVTQVSICGGLAGTADHDGSADGAARRRGRNPRLALRDRRRTPAGAGGRVSRTAPRNCGWRGPRQRIGAARST